MENLVIVGAKRTPFGAFGGTLKETSATDLGVIASKGALEQAGVKPEQVDHVVFGSVVQSAADAIYLPRHIGLKVGVPQNIGALGLNRLCGTGFEVIAEACRLIQSGEATVVLAGGAEQMSQIPYVLRNARFGYRMGHSQIEDYLTAALTDSYAQAPMAITAENLAVQYGLDRETVDKYALLSQQRTAAAIEKGLFKDEICPVQIESKKEKIELSKDEHPRPQATLESLLKLKPVFKKDGVVTAGNASGIVDGAAATIVTTEAIAKKNGWKPLAKIKSWASVGCDPKIMGIGPAVAIPVALKKAGLKLSDISLIEVNEAFSAQYLAVEKELGLPREKTNLNGGAIAIGHPLAASGTRIINHLVYALQRTSQKYALGSACIGGGQGIAMIIESV
jgi:acetyl-CoA C-acetyltransferase/acetyl-CoA acyltransferase 2